MSAAISAVVMPKWGMTMTEGTLLQWLVSEGSRIDSGQELAEIETDKMVGVVEAQDAGVLRRQEAGAGAQLTVGGLLGVIADADVPDSEIDSFIEHHRAATPTVPVGSPTSRTVDGALGPVRVLTLGAGPEIVMLLHGFAGAARGWEFTMDALATGRTVLAVDLPGHGESTTDVGGGSAADLGDAVQASLEPTAPASVHLVGHAMGALAAAEIARRMPDRVQSLTLIAPAGFGEEINSDFIDGLIDASSRRQVRRSLELLFARPDLVTRELVEETLRRGRTPGATDALRTLRDTLFPGGRQTVSIAELTASIEIPITVIWGAEDRILPAAQRGSVPARARVELLKDVGHSPQIEAAADTNRVLLEALR